ncbi:MAG TPA: lasso peptide biosynthesis B2 protein [Terriglobales bacterium]|jgi:hypothetical protein|nr:lasso peptide biosynthesis B2 protein [Terriglobales bacterium]
MNRIRKILELSWSDRHLLARSVVAMCAAVAAVRLLPAAYFAAALATSRRPRVRNMSQTPQRIGWAVSVASHYVPGAKCLCQALAAKWMLERAGYPARMHIGVAKDQSHGFAAHAWVETQGTVLVGGETARFHPLPLYPD